MKNKIIIFLIFFLFVTKVSSKESFNFDVSEIIILENGNKFIGKNKGTITSDNGIIINADQFEYDKKLNILKVKGNIKIHDTVNNYLIFSETGVYDKKKELILTDIKSKGVSLNDNIIIEAKRFKYNKLTNVLEAINNVFVEDKVRKYEIYSDYLKYLRKKEIIFTEGNSRAINLISQNEVSAEKFEYNIDKEILYILHFDL